MKETLTLELLGSAQLIIGIILVFTLICPTINAQNSTVFTPTDKFSFPDFNSSLNFSTEGSYELASFENGAWKFVNLLFPSSLQHMGPEYFKVS